MNELEEQEAISTTSITVLFQGAFVANLLLEGGRFTGSPAVIAIISLVQGANTLTVPTGATGITIQKPAGNSTVLTLKGVAGDTGIALHPTEPDHVSLAVGVSSIILDVADAVEDVRVVWS